MNTIKAIRERLGLSQDALGRGIGCTQGNIFHYERGQTLPPEAAKRVIAFSAERGLALTMDQLYGLQPLPEQPAAQPQQPAQA
jgi:putative transcriptional regulator